MADVTQILADVPETAGAYAPAAVALGQPIHEGVLGDPQLNGEHVVAHVGIKDLLAGRLSDDIVRAAERSEDPANAGTAGLSHVEKVVNNHSRSFDKHIENIFTGPKENPEEETFHPDEHKTLTKDINNLANNPAAMISQISDVTQSLHAVAPQIASSVQQTATRAIQFLASKITQPDPGPLAEEHEPSQTEVTHFGRYLGTVQNPMSALRQIKNGTLTDEAVEVLQNVYPRLYNTMKRSIISNLEPSIPYQTKMALSQFLGEPLDSSMSAERVASLQSSFIPAQNAQPPQSAKAPKKSLSKLNLADRTSLGPNDGD